MTVGDIKSEVSSQALVSYLKDAGPFTIEAKTMKLSEAINSIDVFAVRPKHDRFILELYILVLKDFEEVDRWLREFEGNITHQILVIAESLSLPQTTILLSKGIFRIFRHNSLVDDLISAISWFFTDDMQVSLVRKQILSLLELTKIENMILEALLKSGREGLSRHELMETCWRDVKVHPKTLDVHLFHLRKKLTDQPIAIVNGNNRWLLEFSPTLLKS